MHTVLLFFCKRRIGIFGVMMAFFSFFAYGSLYNAIPDTVLMEKGEDIQLGAMLPVSVNPVTNGTAVESFDVISADKQDTRVLQCSMFGVIPIKKVTVRIVDPTDVIPGGIPIGIYVRTKGVLVVDTARVTQEDSGSSEPSADLLRSGDYIIAVNQENISRKEELVQAIRDSDGSEVELSLVRDQEILDVSVEPVLSASGEYRIGAWIRDDMAGVGTLTYLCGDGSFGALGHSISDMDTGDRIELMGGTAYDVDIIDIVKGSRGNPGELVGQIAYDPVNEIGSIRRNTANGIFGELDSVPDDLADVAPVEIGYKQEIVPGDAQIIVDLNHERQMYDIEIESLDMNPEEPNKGIRLRITDPALIEKTGGIIQGLSGSPIIQNGKLVGGVTHVFVSDPLEGYGIFIEDMLQQ